MDPIIARLEDTSQAVRSDALDICLRKGDLEVLNALAQKVNNFDADQTRRYTITVLLQENNTGAAIERCREMLDDPRGEGRYYALTTLTKIGGIEAIGILADQLKRSEPTQRIQIIDALGEMTNDRAVLPIADCLTDPDNKVKLLAIEVLLYHKRQDLVRQPLLEIFNHADGEERLQAAIALARIGEHCSTEYLLAMVDDKDATIRQRLLAMAGLRAAPDPRAVVKLIELLKNPEEQIRNGAISSIGQMNNEKATITLLEYMDRVPTSAQCGMIKNFGKYKVSRAKVAVMKRLTVEIPVLRALAAEAMGSIGGKDAVPALIPLLDDENYIVRRAAAESIYLLAEDTKITDIIIQHSKKEQDRYVLALYAKIIGKIGNMNYPYVMDSLLRLLDNPNELPVRQSVIEALKKVTGNDCGSTVEGWKNWWSNHKPQD